MRPYKIAQKTLSLLSYTIQAWKGTKAIASNMKENRISLDKFDKMMKIVFGKITVKIQLTAKLSTSRTPK